MKKLLMLMAVAWTSFAAFAQTENTELLVDETPGRVHFNARLQTNHLWRGLIVTDQPVITGEMWFDLTEDGALKLGFWGASALSNDDDGTHYKEINYYLNYEKNGLQIGLWDLYNTRNVNAAVASSNIFNYSKSRTNHILDFRSSYRLQGNFPMRFEFDVPIYGGANAGEVTLDNNGKYDFNRYSTYVEISYPFFQDKKVHLNTFVGAGFPLSSKHGSSHLYGNGENNFDIVNVGFTASRDVKVLGAKVPIEFTTMWNPSLKFARVQIAATVFAF